MSLSERKKREIRTKKKEAINAMRKNLNLLIKKMETGESLRDEEQRTLRFIFKNWEALEESIAEEGKEELPEGTLKQFVEQVWKLKAIGEPEQVIEATNYYRCEICGELHPKKRKCMYEEYKEIKVDQEIEDVS